MMEYNRIVAVDPGPKDSAYVVLKGGKPVSFGKFPNDLLKMHHLAREDDKCTTLVIEQVAAMGMAVGAEVFETVFWSGRFAERWHGQWDRVKRHEVKMHLCGNMRAKDANIRTALLDRFGPGKELAVGKKSAPGPLYGLSGDCWSALAIAVTYWDTKVLQPLPSP